MEQQMVLFQLSWLVLFSIGRDTGEMCSLRETRRRRKPKTPRRSRLFVFSSLPLILTTTFLRFHRQHQRYQFLPSGISGRSRPYIWTP